MENACSISCDFLDTPNTRLERTRHERAFITSCVGEPLKRSVILLRVHLRMSFTSLEIQLIHKLVGEFCQRRSPEDVQDRVRLSYTIGNHEVVIFEERQSFHDAAGERILLEIAKLKYVRVRNEWHLYWKRASGKWWPYEPHSSSKTLAATIKEIDVDSNGCFFG